MGVAHWLCNFAGAPGQRIDVARAALAEAFPVVNETGERWIEADLYRLRGKLSLAAPARDEHTATEDFHMARPLAANQGAKLLELRAAFSLAQRWHDHGEAHRSPRPSRPDL
jgi:predicted ATPase